MMRNKNSSRYIRSWVPDCVLPQECSCGARQHDATVLKVTRVFHRSFLPKLASWMHVVKREQEQEQSIFTNFGKTHKNDPWRDSKQRLRNSIMEREADSSYITLAIRWMWREEARGLMLILYIPCPKKPWRQADRATWCAQKDMWASCFQGTERIAHGCVFWKPWTYQERNVDEICVVEPDFGSSVCSGAKIRDTRWPGSKVSSRWCVSQAFLSRIMPPSFSLGLVEFVVGLHRLRPTVL
jgi:hypothetical protein